ncbi:hypothetical protein EKO23_13770 [Nocardioides guangzhouensis]|uniref:Uncharacterized protein n=1 Tax=Nocardioides guangzhouensis TaxID=2497878 RepID=A0A4Q4ZAQ8_9ACTN|nr:hypothetical protein [Nocardioides guangzhouensis]RYP85050.1 hypothetical protein EKO23_13770 [Nocardioides guangzhouensis]
MLLAELTTMLVIGTPWAFPMTVQRLDTHQGGSRRRLDGSVGRRSTAGTWRRVPPDPAANVDRADDVWAIGACPR